MLGNQAVARGLYEAGVTVVSSYPGTPSTEITEFAAKYNEMHSEWAPNEKVACETAIGASIGGARSFCGMKHVGLNVAADPLFTAAYTGVGGGLVIGVADDPGMHSSQNEQDSRHYAIASKVAMVEPSDSGECKEYTKLAYELSEKFDTPVILRLSTRVSHSQSVVEEEARVEKNIGEYEKNAPKYVMMPAYAKPKHIFVEERTRKLTEYAENCPFNRIEWGDKKIGVITSGISYQYAKEALGDKASYLKLGLVNPLPVQLIKDFAQCLKECFENRGVPFRTGGDEFYVLFSDVEVDMSAMMRRLLIGIEGTATDSEIRISCSRGCYADYVPSHNEAAIWDIIKLADAEMYKQKKADRQARLKAGITR